MKIVLISQNVSPGFLIFRKNLIKLLVSKGNEVYAFALDYDIESKKKIEELGAIPISYSLNKAGTNPLRDLKDIWHLSRKIKKISPNVVFSFFVKPSLYGTLAAKIAGVPRRIAMLEGLGYIHTTTKSNLPLKKVFLQYIHGALCTICYSFANKVLFLNPDDIIDLSKRALIAKKKCTLLGPIGINLESYPYSPIQEENKLRFIFVARLLAEKGFFEYVEAARIIKKKHPLIEFVVLGGLDKENPAALSKAQLDKMIKENIIIYPGHVTNVIEWLVNSHVFILPSYREGYPRSTQEAMATGRAIITTDVPGCRETVIDGINGFLVPPFSPQALVDKIEFFIENPEKAQQMGYESHKIAKNLFDINKIDPLLINILTEK